MALSKIQCEILETLVRRVRFLSHAQLRRTWGEVKLPPEFVQSRTIVARNEIELLSPLVTWEPGDQDPPFGEVSYRLKSRWKEPVAAIPILIGTKKAANLFGGVPGKLPRGTEQTHDLHVAKLYLQLRDATWRSEEINRESPRRGEKLPDATILREGRTHAVEFGGAYSKEKLERFHRYCAWKGISYELW